PNGQVGFVVFLVDRYCLGVKNVMADVTGSFTYERNVVNKMRSEYGVKELSPACLRKLVEGAVDYARDLGLPPHPEYQKARVIFSDIEAGQCKEEFEFGKDGKPLFIAGPHDSPERCRHIMACLEERCGPGGYHLIIPMASDAHGVLPPSGDVLLSAPDE